MMLVDATRQIADEMNGCMHFVDGRHDQPLLEHIVASSQPDDPGRLLALRNPDEQLDLSQVVPAPVKAGGCTIHASETPLHPAGHIS